MFLAFALRPWRRLGRGRGFAAGVRLISQEIAGLTVQEMAKRGQGIKTQASHMAAPEKRKVGFRDSNLLGEFACPYTFLGQHKIKRHTNCH
jgi:hypothetical protein